MAESRLSSRDVRELNERFGGAAPEAVLGWALEGFHPRFVLASSFGAEDVVLIDMLWRIDRGARVVTLDTWRLHTETYAVMDQVRRQYGIDVEIYYPDVQAVERMVKERGYNCFYESVENRKLCCGIRKVEPLERALADVDAWATGLRRDQAPTRSDVQLIEMDEIHGGILKLNPLADWDGDRVWAYIREHKVPYNGLHDQGYSSIGCAPCTRAVGPDEDPRGGRWWWELDTAAKECGIHTGYGGSVPLVFHLTPPTA